MLARRPLEPVIMAHLPLMNSELGSSPRPPYMKMPSLAQLGEVVEMAHVQGVSTARRASRPASRCPWWHRALCQAEKVSSCTQDGQEVV